MRRTDDREMSIFLTISYGFLYTLMTADELLHRFDIFRLN